MQSLNPIVSLRAAMPAPFGGRRHNADDALGGRAREEPWALTEERPSRCMPCGLSADAPALAFRRRLRGEKHCERAPAAAEWHTILASASPSQSGVARAGESQPPGPCCAKQDPCRRHTTNGVNIATLGKAIYIAGRIGGVFAALGRAALGLFGCGCTELQL